MPVLIVLEERSHSTAHSCFQCKKIWKRHTLKMNLFISLIPQLEHAKVTQTELMRESFKRDQETTEFLKCQEELQERLDEEVKAREQLALELSKAESEYWVHLLSWALKC